MGLVHGLDPTQKYDCDISNWCLVKLISYRIGIFIGHLPWSGVMILSYPELIPQYRKVCMAWQTRAMRRIKEGSSSEDLLYHLVRYIFNLHFRLGGILMNNQRSMRTILVPTSHLSLRS